MTCLCLSLVHLPSIHLSHTTQTLKLEDVAGGGGGGETLITFLAYANHKETLTYFETEHMPPVLKIFFC